jgi:phosphoglycerate kinase
MKRKTVREIDAAGKRVLVRVDFNVSLRGTGEIEDDSRIRACLPTIRLLSGQGARVILCSHLSRPKGQVVENLRLAPVADRLSNLLGVKVRALRDCIGPEVEASVSAMRDGEIVILENLRFHPGEEANDPAFAASLARLADIYVNDAFGACHRRHASVVGICQFLPAVAGLLLERELVMLGELLENPEQPFAAIVGGAKVSGKLGVLENIITKVNMLFIGGGMAASFLAAKGFSVGNSPVEQEKLEYVNGLLRKAEATGVRVLLPLDVLVAENTRGSSGSRTVAVSMIPDHTTIVDIGPETIALFVRELSACRTVFWNGPMGVYEVPEFSFGTRTIAGSLAELDAVTVIGGGSTAAIVTSLGFADRMSHVSTGGGASLQFIAGEVLPGIAALGDA